MKPFTATAPGLLLLLLSCALMKQSSAEFSTSAQDTFIRDSSNRAKIFHGENFVQKGEPWYPEVLLNEDHIEQMRSWGFNSIRLGVMWSGVEPQMGVYNETYISVIQGILGNLEKYGIHAIIDVHQDVLSSYFCEYDGAPTWLVDLSTSSTHEFPYPLPGECSDRPWGSNYLSEATGAAFQDIYDNVNGMRDHFAAFWSKVATSLKDYDILGYEIINEPWAGNHIENPSLLLPGNAGRKNLQPLYDVIADSIRAADPGHIVMYEPVTWGMIFNGTVSGSGFTHVPGGEQHRDKSVFSFHYYCWWYTDDNDMMQKQTCDRMFGPKVFDQVAEDLKVLGGAAMLTEWGQGCIGTGGGLTGECDPIMNLADEHLIGWTDWYWTGTLMNGWDAQEDAIQIFSRTFAQSISGTPTKMKFDADTLEFDLCYTVDPTIEAPTEIYANFELKYTNGVLVELSGSPAEHMTVDVQSEAQRVFVTYTGGTAQPSTDLDVCVRVSKN